MKTETVLIVMVGLTLAVTVYAAANQGTAVVGGAGGDGARLAAIEERLATIERITDQTRDDVRRAARTAGPRRAATSAAFRPVAAAGAAPGGGAQNTLASDELRQVVADSIKNTVAEQMERIAAEKRNRGADGKWKPPIDEMATALELTEAQRTSLELIFDGARDESFALLRTERPDGGNLLDDFARDLRESEDPKQPWVRFFGALTTKQVPGRNQTYFEAFGEAETRIRERVNANLDARQVRRFDSLNVDVFDVKTGYDPVGVYVMEALGDGAR